MTKLCLILLGVLPILAQTSGKLPRHLIHPTRSLTAPDNAPARAIADAHLKTLSLQAGLGPQDLAGAYLFKEYRSAHNGVTHLVYRQQFQGIDVYNADFVVNIDADGQVLNSGGQLYPRPSGSITAPDQYSAPSALHVALKEVRPSAPIGYLPTGRSAKGRKLMSFARAGLADPVEGQPIWYAVNGALRPAWVFYLTGENGTDRFATVVDSDVQRVIAKDSLTSYQKALVFEQPSPQPNTNPGVFSTTARPYVERTLVTLSGDKTASPKGWVNGNTLSGNNAIAAHNPMGTPFLANGRSPLAVDGNFNFPLLLGPGAPNPMTYWDSATTNLFYWTNRAHDLFYQIGFDEAAGNFQVENFSGEGAGGDPMQAFSHFGAANSGAPAALNNAFFSAYVSYDDGNPVSINMYLAGNGQDKVYTDGSYDAEVMLHEYTHGVSHRLVRQLSGAHGGAMGEAWSDFFSLEFTIPEGAPSDGSYPQGEYFIQSFGTGIRTRPYSSNSDINPLTFASFGYVSLSGPEVHADGEVWVQALWEMRAELIKQFGEKEGRRRVRLLVLDGMKLSPPAPTMVDMRDAILLADRVDFKGASQDQIWTAFAKRGLGVLAYASGPDSAHVAASYERPSSTASFRFTEEKYVLGETVRLVLQDSNNTSNSARVQLTGASGDLETIMLSREGSVFVGTIPTRATVPLKPSGALEVLPSDNISAYYIDQNAGGEPKLIQATVPTVPTYTTISSTAGPYTSGQETAILSLTPGARVEASTRTIVVSLPFEFPFFEKKYTRFWINGSGIISFDRPPLVGGCFDRAALANGASIAPMWMDLAFGSAQTGENIYFSSSSDSVTIRFAAETQPFLNGFNSPDPVNFRVTLFKDGRIQTQYGSGNKNLADTYAYSSLCGASAPTIGISNGHETYVQLSPLDSMPTLENAITIRFDPPWGFTTTPVVVVESPAADDKVKDVLTVKGVAYDDTNFVTRLNVVIDDVAVGQTSPGISRTDYCAANKVPGCPNIGFQLNFNTTGLGLAPGPHKLKIRATNSRGAVVDFPAGGFVPFTIDAGQSRLPVGAIESPAEGAEVSGATTIKGYAYAKDLRVLALDVLVDGIAMGPATYNQRRDDICTSSSVALNCPGVGFTFTLNTQSGTPWLPNGPHSMQVRVRDEVGRYTLIPETPVSFTVNNPSNQPPQGVLVAPQPGAVLSGAVTVSGYAWDPDGRVTSAAILIDGLSTGITAARYGLPSPDACASLPDVKACPNIGFEGTLNTKLFSNGAHTLGIRLTDDKGATTIVPAVVRNGMNVVIQN